MADCPATQTRFVEPVPPSSSPWNDPEQSPEQRRSWYHRPVTKWVLLSLAIVGITAAMALAPRGRKGAELVYMDLIPAWQMFRSNEPLKSDSPAARAMIRAAQAWPSVAAALRALDTSYPDDVPAHAARLNQAAREADVPYWVDVQTVKGRSILLSYRISSRHAWQSERGPVETVRLRRADSLNVELGLLGQSSPNGPLIFLDRIEDDWSRQLAEEPKPDQAVEVGVAELFVVLAGQMDQGDVHPMISGLRERRQSFDVMQNRMHVVVPKPSGLVWGPALFATVAPLTKFEKGRGPMVFDSDLQAVRQANLALERPAFHATMEALVNLRAESVEAHEARHAIEPASPPLAWFLRRYSDPEFAVQINQETRAYLGELHDSPQGPCLSLLGLVRAAYFPKARRTPHFFAGRIIVRALGAGTVSAPKPDADPAQSPGPLDESFPDAEPIGFLRTSCAAPPTSLRAQVAGLWQAFYGEPMPKLVRAK
jgi:hypothetical protein